jgi:RNase P protein component
VLDKRKKLARAMVEVRRGTTRRVKLTLSKSGRKAVKRGRSKRVTIELRLPGGQTFEKHAKLARKR